MLPPLASSNIPLKYHLLLIYFSTLLTHIAVGAILKLDCFAVIQVAHALHEQPSLELKIEPEPLLGKVCPYRPVTVVQWLNNRRGSAINRALDGSTHSG